MKKRINVLKEIGSEKNEKKISSKDCKLKIQK